VIPGVAERARAKFERRLSWVVADGEKGLAGFALATEPGSGAPTDPPAAAVLGLLAVDPAAQNAGLGRRLLREVEGELAHAGFRQAVLHVLTDNTAAVKLYERAGWHAFGAAFDHSLLHRPSQSYLIEL